MKNGLMLGIVALAAAAGTASAATALPSGFDVTVTWGGGTYYLSQHADLAQVNVSESDNGGLLIAFDWNTVPNFGLRTPEGQPIEIAMDSTDGGNTFRFISSTFTLTNNQAVTDDFVVAVSLNGLAPLPATSIFGSNTGTVLDTPAPNIGATLSSTPGLPIYEAFIDGQSVQTLLSGPFSLSAGLGQTNSYAPANFSAVPSIALVDEIGITNRFSLTAGDAATMQSTFFVDIPTPGAAALFGLAGVAGLRRRRGA